MAEKSPDVRNDVPAEMDKAEALKTLKGSTLQRWVEDQERNVSVKTWNAEEQLKPENAEKRAEFTVHAGEMFKEFTNGIQADKAEYGGNPRWRAFHQECAQHIHAYEKATPNQDTPTTLEGMQLMLSSVASLEKTMKQYALEKDVKIQKAPFKPVEAGRADDLAAMEQYDWRVESKKVFDRFEDLRKAIKDKDMKADGVCEDFFDKCGTYFDIYTQYVSPTGNNGEMIVKDEAMARTLLWEFKRMLDSYEPVIQKRLEKGIPAPKEKTADKKGVPAQTTGFTINDFVTKFESLKSDIADGMFEKTRDSATPAIDIRAIILGNGGDEPFPALTKEQLEAALWAKAHISDLGGKPLAGEDTTHFNRADIPAVANTVAFDVIKDAPALYADVVKAIDAKYPGTDKASIASREESKMGARLMIDQYNGITAATLRDPRVDKGKMLATPAEHQKVADGLRELAAAPGKLAEGREKLGTAEAIIMALTIRKRQVAPTQRVIGRPLRNFIVGKRNEGLGKYWKGVNDYNAGKQKVAEFDQGKRDLLNGVRSEIESQLNAAMDKANVEPAENIDTTPRPNVTRGMMGEFETHMKELDGVGKKDLIRKVWMPSEKMVSTVVRKGLNPKPFNFMLDAFANPEGGKGTPPGMLLEVSGLTKEAKELIEKIKKEDEETQNKIAQAAE